MRKFNLIALLATIAITAGLVSCNDNENVDVESRGRANVKITDAPVDAENIEGVYLAVVEVQAGIEGDVETIATFDEPKVFNVMDYRNGSTFALAEGELEAGTYDELRLILADGSSSEDTSSSYIQFDDGSTTALTIPSGTTSGYKIQGDFEVSTNGETDLVIDIDLRKALVEANSEYKLRPTARLLVEGSLSTINGEISDMSAEANERLVVYAYAEGSYTGSEADEPAEGETRFENAINSAVVAEDGTFTLAFMEEGEYELIVASYEKSETEDEYHFTSATVAEIAVGANILESLSLEANADVSVVLRVSLL